MVQEGQAWQAGTGCKGQRPVLGQDPAQACEELLRPEALSVTVCNCTPGEARPGTVKPAMPCVSRKCKSERREGKGRKRRQACRAGKWGEVEGITEVEIRNTMQHGLQRQRRGYMVEGQAGRYGRRVGRAWSRRSPAVAWREQAEKCWLGYGGGQAGRREQDSCVVCHACPSVSTHTTTQELQQQFLPVGECLPGQGRQEGSCLKRQTCPVPTKNQLFVW